MRYRSMLIVATVVALLTGGLRAQAPAKRTPTGDFALLDLNGRKVNFSSLKGPLTVVIFMSTRCPMSNAFNYRRNVLYKEFQDRAHFVVIDSNENEPVAEIRQYVRELGFDFPVYKDIENTAADVFGVHVTTDTLVLDASGNVKYHGYLEDSPNPSKAKKQGLRMAIQALLDGRPVPMPETRSSGCSIRRLVPLDGEALLSRQL